MNQCFDLNKDIRVLDLCAAPGGKSTLLLDALSPNSFFLANEVINKRYGILRENLQRWGTTNYHLSNHDPSDFKGSRGRGRLGRKGSDETSPPPPETPGQAEQARTSADAGVEAAPPPPVPHRAVVPGLQRKRRELSVPIPVADAVTSTGINPADVVMSAYRRHGDAITIVGVAVAMTMEGERCAAVRIALGSVAPYVVRAPSAEAVLAGEVPTPARIEQAAERAVADCDPIDDIRASAAYRRHGVHVLTRRLLTRAVERLS